MDNLNNKNWQCENPKCKAIYAEYVNGCPKCATGEVDGSYSIFRINKTLKDFNREK